MHTILRTVWLMFTMLFTFNEPAAPIIPCLPDAPRNTRGCSNSGWKIPGFATGETWTRQEDTPRIFYGRGTYYAPGIMWATAIERGFDREYLQQFDCLLSGFFLNDVGRVAWVLHGGDTYQCLVVDNAWSRDIYNVVVNAREAMEVEYTFAKDVLGNTVPYEPHPVVVIAYQQEEPTVEEWRSAERLDTWLVENWQTSYEKEPKALIQVRENHETWYRLVGQGSRWYRIPGCLECTNQREGLMAGELVKEYTVIQGDTLKWIAQKVYGFKYVDYWEVIYAANADKISNPYHITAGMILDIPDISEMPAITQEETNE